jgi:hypothetical protein
MDLNHFFVFVCLFFLPLFISLNHLICLLGCVTSTCVCLFDVQKRQEWKRSAQPAQPAQSALIRPAPQTPNMLGYCDFCLGVGLKKSKPARCGAGWEKANTHPASTCAHL